MSYVGESSYGGASRHPAKRRSAREIACPLRIPSVTSGGKSFHNLSKFHKNDQNFIKIVNYHVIFVIHIRHSMPQVEKTNPIAGLRPEIRSTKFDNSGVFTGCLLPGVVPEIRNCAKQSQIQTQWRFFTSDAKRLPRPSGPRNDRIDCAP